MTSATDRISCLASGWQTYSTDVERAWFCFSTQGVPFPISSEKYGVSWPSIFFVGTWIHSAKSDRNREVMSKLHKFGWLFHFHYSAYFCLSCWFSILVLLNFIWKKRKSFNSLRKLQAHQIRSNFRNNHKMTVTNKLTCFGRLALLGHIPQKVLLNTYLLWKNTGLPSVHTTVLVSQPCHLNIPIPPKSLTWPVSFSSWYCLICFPWQTSYVQYDSICSVGKKTRTTSCIQQAVRAEKVSFRWCSANVALTPSEHGFSLFAERVRWEWNFSPCRNSCFVWIVAPAARPDWAHCTPYHHPKTIKDTKQTQERSW